MQAPHTLAYLKVFSGYGRSYRAIVCLLQGSVLCYGWLVSSAELSSLRRPN